MTPTLAVSCCHVCLADGSNPENESPVTLVYYPGDRSKGVLLSGTYLPTESNLESDIAVIDLGVPANVTLVPLALSEDAHAGAAVEAVGFVQGEADARVIPGKIDVDHPIVRVTYGTQCGGGLDEADHAAMPVERLRIDKRSGGTWGDRVIEGGMSGGPLINVKTNTVVGIVDGKLRRSGGAPAEGYAIELQHLKSGSLAMKRLVAPAAVRSRWRWRRFAAAVFVVGLVLAVATVQWMQTSLVARLAVGDFQGLRALLWHPQLSGPRLNCQTISSAALTRASSPKRRGAARPSSTLEDY